MFNIAYAGRICYNVTFINIGLIEHPALKGIARVRPCGQKEIT